MVDDPKTTCPRRMHELGPWDHAAQLDCWQVRDGHTVCSFCGSVEPAEFLAMVEAGAEVVPTDKSYKAYLKPNSGRQLKFYFQHFDDVSGPEFVRLHNESKMKMAFPGYFYVRPFVFGLKT
jgi:hypothetical protein